MNSSVKFETHGHKKVYNVQLDDCVEPYEVGICMKVNNGILQYSAKDINIYINIICECTNALC